MKKFLVYFLLILVALLAFSFAYRYPGGKRWTSNQNIQIKSYSLNGKVTAVQGNQISFQVGVVYETWRGNIVKQDSFVGVATDKTKIFITTIKPTLKSTPSKISDIKSGSEIVVYSSVDPYSGKSFNLDRLDILIR